MILLAISLLALGPSYRLSRVHPELRGLTRPYREAHARFYFDEGSIGFDVVDSAGKRQYFRLPVRYGYQRLYFGARYVPGAATVPLNEDSKRYLLEMYEQCESGPDKETAIAILRNELQNNFHYYWNSIFGGE